MQQTIRHILLPACVGLAIGAAVLLLLRVGNSGGEDVRPAERRTGYADAVARAAPAVVNIYSRIREVPPSCLRDANLRPWCERLMGVDRTSLGSGVIVHPRGYVLTNAHVIAGASEIVVMLSDGRSAEASLVGSDELTDLAVVRVPFTDLTPIQLGDSDAVAVGDLALAIGNPFGIGQTVSQGIISAKGRASLSASPYDDFLQTDAAINPGNSGGALIDATGRLIGINTLIISSSGQTMGVGLAIPARLAYEVLEEIISTGAVVRGWLGLTLDPMPAPDPEGGIVISSIEAGGPAALAGLVAGDRILALDGEAARDPHRLSRAIGRRDPGQMLELLVLRKDERLPISVVAGRRPED